MALRFAEELLLLILNEDHGGLTFVPESHLHHALAGAVLLELEIEHRIDTDPGTARLVLVDPAPVGDDLLDPALAEVAQAEETRDAGWWVRRIARHGRRIRERVLARLLEAGIVTSAEENAVLLAPRVFRSRRYPTADGQVEQEVRLRIMNVLFSGEVPDPRDVVIIGLADACGLFAKILTPAELREAARRIDVVRRMDVIGRAVADAVRASAREADAPAARVEPKEIPFVRGLPVLGSALDVSGDLIGFLAQQYRTLGPVFGIRVLNRKVLVIAGREANRFANEKGRLFLRTYEPWREFGHVLDASRTILGMEGKDHVRTRQALARDYSRARARQHLDTLGAIALRHAAAGPVGRTVRPLTAMQRVVGDQMGEILTGASIGEHVEDVVSVLEAMLATVMTSRPPGFLAARRSRRARARLDELARKTLDAHRPGGPLHDASDLVNDVLDLHRADSQLVPETDLKIMVLTPYLAGIETAASTAAFALYALLKDPDLTARVQAEADALFTGPLTVERLGLLDVTHRTVLESLRRYPTGPLLVRHVSNTFDFAGYRIPAGRTLWVASAVTHRLPECFPDPERFDVDRYLPERAEHRQPDAYVPFGVGMHRCLGAGFAEVQILMTLAATLHTADLAIDPPGYELKVTAAPTPRPTGNFRLRVVRRRRPAA